MSGGAMTRRRRTKPGDVPSSSGVEDAVVTGVVVGDAGREIGGYAKLGPHGERRTIGERVVVRTDDGHEVELVELAAATIQPLVSRKAPWSELEEVLGARVCIDDAPAPDVVTELIVAVVRAGERIAAWGPVLERAFEGTSGHYRSAAQRRIVRLAPTLVVLGHGCEERLAALREAQVVRAGASVEAASEPPLSSHARSATPWYELRTVPLGLWVMLPAVLVFSLVAGLRWFDPSMALVSLGAALVLPLASQCLALRFHDERQPAETRASAVWLARLYGIGALCIWILAVAAYGTPRNYSSIPLVALLGGLLTIVTASALLVASQRERRLLRTILEAPAHADPISDRVWGAIEGRARGAEQSVVVADDPCIVASGARQQGEELETIAVCQDSFVVGGITVRPRGMLWFSTTSRDVESRLGTLHVDVIREGAKVRVVGRAKDGVLAKGGEDSLLMFATDRDGAPLATAQKLVRWIVASVIAACVGLVVMGAGVVLGLRALT